MCDTTRRLTTSENSHDRKKKCGHITKIIWWNKLYSVFGMWSVECAHVAPRMCLNRQQMPQQRQQQQQYRMFIRSWTEALKYHFLRLFNNNANKFYRLLTRNNFSSFSPFWKIFFFRLATHTYHTRKFHNIIISLNILLLSGAARGRNFSGFSSTLYNAGAGGAGIPRFTFSGTVEFRAFNKHPIRL